jgi:1-acyl-sn-glycerol-3-phosphate acyltransferase
VFYDLVTRLLMPGYWWGRARAEGVEEVPEHGPLLIVPNHDSQWDPIVVALALRKRRRLHFLARANLWKIPGLGPILYALGQIPIERGAHDRGALDKAVTRLREGDAVCVFPEGRLSRGEALRARSGVGWLAHACPGVQVVLCSVEGTTDYARFPRRPRVRLRFFPPREDGPAPGEDPAALAARLLGELRERVPPDPAGRRAGRTRSSNQLVELADLEDFGAAIGARALDRRATVLHGHLLRVLDLNLLAFLDAVALGHVKGPPFSEWA